MFVRRNLYCYLTASPLPTALLAVVGFLAAGLVAWQYSDRLSGLLACWIFAASFFVLLVVSVAMCVGQKPSELVILARLSAKSRNDPRQQFAGGYNSSICLALAASLQPLTTAHCFTTLRPH